jgi:hypothetical protein
MEDLARQREMSRQRMQREEEARRRQQLKIEMRQRDELETARQDRERAERQKQQSRVEAADSRAALVSMLGRSDAASGARPSKSRSPVAIIELLRSPSSLQNAVILKEVLDQPVAFRDA